MATSHAFTQSRRHLCPISPSQRQNRAAFSLATRPHRAHLCPRRYLFLRRCPYLLRAEVERYNYHQVHSTTGEIPAIRFEKAKTAGNSLFRPFSLPKPFTSLKDVFCLHDTRALNGYRKISLGGMEIEIPKVPIREDVDIHFVPLSSASVEIRIWYENKLVHSLTLPSVKFPGVHF